MNKNKKNNFYSKKKKQAEYLGLIMGLELALSLGVEVILCKVSLSLSLFSFLFSLFSFFSRFSLGFFFFPLSAPPLFPSFYSLK